MKLMEALRVLGQNPSPDARPFEVYLACGFTPLHLETFLAAHLRQRLQNRPVKVRVGLFGDAVGNIERLSVESAEAGAIVLEWSDFDPRLGLRQLGGWSPKMQADIVSNATIQARRIRDAVDRVAGPRPVAISLSTLPLTPVSHLPGSQAGVFALELEALRAQLAVDLARLERVRMINPDRLGRLSPPGERLDVRSDLNSGFPYRVPHADALGSLLATLITPSSPMKGLITDLDDTVWRGIVGDQGVAGISWDLNHHTQIHGLYQQLLNSISEAGVLVGVASKNDAQVVDQAFNREDLILSRQNVFPLEVHWEPKSTSVRKILAAWNIGADSVIFVDDNPMELAEVKASFPEMECWQFPTLDEEKGLAFLESLRDRFGKESISQEDSLRRESLRQSAEFSKELKQHDTEDVDGFLAQMEAELTIDFLRDGNDRRAFELVNKTNQFNLNGLRFSEGQWTEQIERNDSFLMRVSYRDKFGPLGIIGVLIGQVDDQSLRVTSWVLSCRAFSRRIEHQCLKVLLDRYGDRSIAFEYKETLRNGPLREFLTTMLGSEPDAISKISLAEIVNRLPALYHSLITND